MVDKRIIYIFSIVYAVAFVLHALSFQYTVDDAFISYRYAENWIGGAGLVFNVGERLEGYTNFLWTVLAALPVGMGIDVVLFMRFAGIAAGLALIFLAWHYSRKKLDRHPITFLLPVALIANGSLALWSGAGLETSLFTLLLFAGVAAAAGERGRRPFVIASLLLALATLTRPEGAIVFAVLVIDRLAGGRSAVRTVVAGSALFLLLLVPFELWRIAYYGEPLPNTWYAKSGGGLGAMVRGAKYLFSYVGPFGGWTAAAAIPLIFLVRVRSWERTFLAVLIVLVAYVIWVGGDALPYFRFLVPTVPITALLAVSGLSKLFPWPERKISSSRLAAFAVLLALPAYSSFSGAAYDFLVQDRSRVELHWKVIGQWFAENGKAGETMAVTTAGAIPYYSGMPAIDMLGITDRHIARKKMPNMGSGIAGHEKHDMDYVLSRQPTYILHYTFLLPKPLFTTGQFKTPWNEGLAELLTNERFNREYQGESASIGKMHLVYFKRKEGA